MTQCQDIKFPLSYDAFELCTPALKEKLQPMRDRFEEARQRKIEKELVSFMSIPFKFIVLFEVTPLGDGVGQKLAKSCERLLWMVP